MSKIGNLIKELRVKKGMTQAQLADELGITDKAVGKWEQGQGEPDLSLIKPISVFFGITTDELLNGSLDEFSKDIHKSIYEKIVLSGISKLPQFLEQGIQLFGKDEYNKTLIDYVYQYQSLELLTYALENNWFEHLDIRFQILKSNHRYGNTYIDKNIKVYYQKHLRGNVKGFYIPSTNPELRQTKLMHYIEEYGQINSNLFDVFDNDTKNILAIILKHDKKELFNNYINYNYFKKADIQTFVLKSYVNRNSYNIDLLKDVIKVFSYGELFHLSIESNNKTLIDHLAEIYDESYCYIERQYICDFIKLNHPEINRKILLNFDFNSQEEFESLFEYNRYIYDRLPEEKKQKSAKYLSKFIQADNNHDLVLHQNILDLVKENNLDLIDKHLKLVDQKVKEIDMFVDQLVVLKKNNQSIFDKVTLKTFNELFGKCLSYNVFNYVAYFNNDGILKPDQLKELDLINEQRKNHLWLEQKILSSTGDVKKTIYGFIKYTFSNSFEYELSRVSDEILLLLIPYLNESIIHEILNNYNKENSTVIKLLLEKGGKFYNQYQGNPNKKIEFKYSTIDFRTMREIEIDKNRVSSRFDMIKTLQFKLLLGIK